MNILSQESNQYKTTLAIECKGKNAAAIKRRLEFDRFTWTGSIGFLAKKGKRPSLADGWSTN